MDGNMQKALISIALSLALVACGTIVRPLVVKTSKGEEL